MKDSLDEYERESEGDLPSEESFSDSFLLSLPHLQEMNLGSTGSTGSTGSSRTDQSTKIDQIEQITWQDLVGQNDTLTLQRHRRGHVAAGNPRATAPEGA